MNRIGLIIRTLIISIAGIALAAATAMCVLRFDGTIRSPFDTAGLPMLTEALLKAGLSGGDLAKMLGGNVRRVLAANLPE